MFAAYRRPFLPVKSATRFVYAGYEPNALVQVHLGLPCGQPGCWPPWPTSIRFGRKTFKKELDYKIYRLQGQRTYLPSVCAPLWPPLREAGRAASLMRASACPGPHGSPAAALLTPHRTSSAPIHPRAPLPSCLRC